MAKTIDYYYALISPWTYLGGPRLEEIARRHGAAIAYKPVALGKVFPVSGGLPLAKRAPQRQAYRLVELARWRDFLGVPLNLKPRFFPADETLAAGMVIAARRQGLDCGRLSNAILRGVWAEERDIADAATLKAIAAENALDGDALMAAAADPAVTAEYEANTQEAIDRGVFGAPSYVYKDELFWGQDRLDFLDRALAKG
jgi:2-hydroxychromene-2-carboxylate isomerase